MIHGSTPSAGRNRKLLRRALAPLGIAWLCACGCSSDDADGDDDTQDDSDDTTADDSSDALCVEDEACFADLTLDGTPRCLNQVQGGYCTHTCEQDADCCAVEFECLDGVHAACAPLGSAQLCFFSCDDDAMQVYGGSWQDANAFCQQEVHPDFACTSIGDRQLCVPGN